MLQYTFEDEKRDWWLTSAPTVKLENLLETLKKIPLR